LAGAAKIITKDYMIDNVQKLLLINKPIGVADYTTKLVESLPKKLKSSLPTVEEIEAELEKVKIARPVKAKKSKKIIT
jgi:hypothetical protein